MAASGVTGILRSFRLAQEWERGKQIHDWSKWEFLQKFSANNCVLSDAEKLKRGNIVDLSVLTKHIVICHVSQVSEEW